MTFPGPANNTFSPYDEIWACGELLGLRGGGFCALILFYKFLKIEVIYSGKIFLFQILPFHIILDNFQKNLNLDFCQQMALP